MGRGYLCCSWVCGECHLGAGCVHTLAGPRSTGQWGTHCVSRLPCSGGSFFPQNQVITFPSSFSLIARGSLVLRFKVGVSLRFWSFLAAGTFMGKGRCMCQVDRILWTQGMV